MKTHNIFYIELLKPYLQDKSGFPAPQAQLVLIDGQVEWEIEKIKNHRAVRGQYQFLVSWLGAHSSEDQWLDESKLSHALELLASYKHAV